MESVHGGADMPEVARIHDDLDVAVLRGKTAQNGHRAVGGGVIDEDVLVAIPAERRMTARTLGTVLPRYPLR